MSTFSSLEIGKRALAAQRLGLDVTSNNIANVNTPNYSRRQVEFSETDPTNSNGAFLGTGVVIDNLRTYRDELFDKEIRNTLSRQSGYETDQKVTDNLQSILNEPSDIGLNQLVSNFFNAFQNLSLNPEDTSVRANVLSTAQDLVDSLHSTAQSMESARADTATQLSQNVAQINFLLKDIADLNSKIGNANAQNGGDAETYIDQREQKLESLAQLTGINVTQGDYGTVNLYINGINVVTGSSFTNIQVKNVVNSTTGEKTIQLINTDSKGNLLNYITPQSGEVASQLKAYNVTYDNLDSSGGFSVYKNLDDFANALVNKVNSLSILGYGLNDTSGSQPGRNIFEPSVGGATALTISLSADVKDNPGNLPVSDSAGETGNNVIALKIANLANDNSFINSQNPTDFYSDFIGKVASMGSEAQNGATATKSVADQLTNQRDSIIGVNLDEEAVNLIKYQQAFEASSRVINTTNQILQTIISLGQ